MEIRFEHSLEVKASPAQVFALLDDLPQTPKWLGPCTALSRVSPGTPNAVGDKLSYTYKQGGREGHMDGEIVTRIPDQQLVCRYLDPLFEVVVDLRVSASTSGSTMTHVITSTPKTMAGKFLSPLIRMGLPKQTQDAMDSLKKMLEPA